MLSGKKKLLETRCEYYCDYYCFSLQQYKNNLIKLHQKRALYIYSTYKQYKTKLIQPHQKRTPTYSTYKQHKTNLVKPQQKRAPIFMLHSNDMSQVTNTCITLWSTPLFNKAGNQFKLTPVYSAGTRAIFTSMSCSSFFTFRAGITLIKLKGECVEVKA